ncbi:MAG TPA: VWA domain-containing protein [Pyrinomonadaceae bacterium]|nr:VWA domain-containing protein [Pyrinomonadaceae bacterium]
MTPSRQNFADEPARRLPPLACSLLCCALVALSAALPPNNAARAANPQDDDEVERVNADLVVLNVTVTDKAGKYVHKIPRKDFRVFEDGREQKISTFSIEETPFAAAILLDTSGSMEGRISLARSAAIRFLDGLREDDVAAIYSFDSKVEQLQDFLPGRDLPPMAYGVNARGVTTLYDAVVRASQDLAQRPEKRRAIVVLSDGADTRSGATQDKALRVALEAHATIYTVDLSDPRANIQDRQMAMGALKNFAFKTGGRYVPTPGGQALAQAFEGIVEELSNQYTIGYQSLNRARDGRWRDIEINISRPEVNARTRRGYRAPKA